jgi:hypothetical protein
MVREWALISPPGSPIGDESVGAQPPWIVSDSLDETMNVT